MLKNCFLKGVTEILALLYLSKSIVLHPVRAECIYKDHSGESRDLLSEFLLTELQLQDPPVLENLQNFPYWEAMNGLCSPEEGCRQPERHQACILWEMLGSSAAPRQPGLLVAFWLGSTAMPVPVPRDSHGT